MRKLVAAGVMLSALVVLVGTAAGSHSWNGYHWARTANPFTLKLGDNVSSVWDASLAGASSDWSQSSVLDTTIVAGQGRKNCRPTSGRVEVCNRTYGNTGWLGIAQIWITDGTHITQGVVKVNDTYFNSPPYNTSAWRNFVVCQEVGHTLGLDHQDENFDNPNLGTCMDYTSNPSTNQRPNQHDYQQLEAIYAHLDSTSTVGAAAGFLPEAVPSFAPANRVAKSVYVDDLGNGRKLVTYVLWTS